MVPLQVPQHLDQVLLLLAERVGAVRRAVPARLPHVKLHRVRVQVLKVAVRQLAPLRPARDRLLGDEAARRAPLEAERLPARRTRVRRLVAGLADQVAGTALEDALVPFRLEWKPAL